MNKWIYVSAILATLLSICNLSYLAYKEHDRFRPRTLSELAADRPESLLYFRIILWLCGTLFAISMYGYLIPNISNSLLLFISWSVTYISELALAVFPATGRFLRIHNILALLMGAGMLSTAYIFTFSFSGLYMSAELLVSLVMSIFATLTLVDKKRFIFYELPFIFLAHSSILLALLYWP